MFDYFDDESYEPINYHEEPDNRGMDEDMYACTNEWRRLHPYDYNPYTGGSSGQEDEENGW